MNLCILVGNLTRDPELRYTADGKSVTNFSIAINEGSGDRKSVTFLNCVAWLKTAELVAEYCRKGSKVLVQGRITIDEWATKEGEKRRAAKIVATNVTFLDPRQREADPEQPSFESLADELDEMPF